MSGTNNKSPKEMLLRPRHIHAYTWVHQVFGLGVCQHQIVSHCGCIWCHHALGCWYFSFMHKTVYCRTVYCISVGRSMWPLLLAWVLVSVGVHICTFQIVEYLSKPWIYPAVGCLLACTWRLGAILHLHGSACTVGFLVHASARLLGLCRSIYLTVSSFTCIYPAVDSC